MAWAKSIGPRDTSLDRDVAIKVLPDLFASDPERLARFEREAKTLAALNHPNIGQIHGLEISGGIRALVMELVDGDDLSQRISQGPVSLSDTLPIARQIADAIEAAHSQGIVHRDLKPANIKLRPDGTVKVLDFGLAKALGSAAAAGADPASSPTLTTPAGTLAGVILGTAAYMAPEQARGKAVDKRADVWAFGCVLFEMLTGQRAFVADGVTDTLATVITKDPNWAALPQATPPAIRRLLRRCLEKNPRDRIHDIADARLDIEETLAGRDADGAAPAATTTPARRATTAWFVAAVTGVALVAALTFAAAIYDPDQLATIPTARYMVAPPDGWRVSTVQSAAGATVPLSVSPDGRRIAFIARNAEGKDLLWIQPLDALAAYPLAGTEGAIAPFWSADSRFVGFAAEQKLKKIEASGGVPFSICDVGPFRGGAWNGDDLIVFATSTGGLQKVSAAGGAPAAATVVQAGEIYHTRPLFLPSSRRFLFRVMPAGETYAGSLDSDERALVLKGSDSTNIALSRSHLLFLRETTLMAQPFDSRQLRVTSDAFPIAEHIVTQNALGSGNQIGMFASSDNGVLAFQTGAAPPRLAWFSRTGQPVDIAGEDAWFQATELSPDAKRAAVVMLDTAQRNRDIWIVDLARGHRTRFTFDPGDDVSPVWSADASRVVFASRRGRYLDLYQKASNGGAGTEQILLTSDVDKFPWNWSHDGRFLLFGTQSAATGSDLWVLPMAGDRKPVPFLATKFNETLARLSPDARWVA